MNVRWAYDGLSMQHTPAEVDDPTAYDWNRIEDSELIVHAANLHLYRSNSGQRLWSSTMARPSPENSLSPDLK